MHRGAGLALTKKVIQASLEKNTHVTKAVEHIVVRCGGLRSRHAPDSRRMRGRSDRNSRSLAATPSAHRVPRRQMDAHLGLGMHTQRRQQSQSALECAIIIAAGIAHLVRPGRHISGNDRGASQAAETTTNIG